MPADSDVAVAQETAINIAFACSLLRSDMTQYIVNVDCPEVAILEDAGRKEVQPKMFGVWDSGPRVEGPPEPLNPKPWLPALA